jgi:UDP-N-acetylmuramyl pentapeptide phosphotransferase/UDP-N-acetylglucosamine-1-phosphate transferase
MLVLIVSVGAAALISAALIVALKPLLLRYALARPNARSSHKSPTPQGGGIAVVGATFLAAAGALWFAPPAMSGTEITWVGAAALTLAVVGVVDDIRPLPAMIRLILQIAAVVAVIVASGSGRILPEPIPLWLERGLLVIAGVWFVNLVNFMDGIDWMTAAEVVPVAAALALLGAAGVIPLWVAVIAAALLGAMLGFAPFNKPEARLFLGDVGALPIGLLAGWMLLKLAMAGAVAAALLLPLYYLADATITLLRRLVRGERVWEAHRQHFYPGAIDRNGYSVTEVVREVFLLNLALAALAFATIVSRAWPMQMVSIIAGGALVAFVLRRFATARSKRALP